MKDRNKQIYSIFNIALLCFCLPKLFGLKDDSIKSQGLVVCKESLVLCNEKVAGDVWAEGPVRYQTCSGALFPLAGHEKCIQSVRGVLCFSTGGIAVPISLSNFTLFQCLIFPAFGGLLVVPLFIKSLKASILQGCGITHAPSNLQAKAITNFNGVLLVPVEISTRIEFCDPFCELPSVEVLYNTQANELLLPCTFQSLNFEDPDEGPVDATALWVNAEAYAADVTQSGFTLTLLLYISISSDSLGLGSSAVIALNRFINQIINKSEVSFLAEGKTAQIKKCC